MAKILVVEDDPQFVDTVTQMLKRGGHEPVAVTDGQAAVERLRTEPFELILLDIIMPNKEGLETLIEIRESWPETWVVCMSGGGRSGNFDPLELSGKFGADATLAKPFRPADLREKIGECLGQPS